jgi:hypothetical protein
MKIFRFRTLALAILIATLGLLQGCAAQKPEDAWQISIDGATVDSPLPSKADKKD